MEGGSQVSERNSVDTIQRDLNRFFRRKRLEILDNPSDQIIVFATPVTLNPGYEHSLVFGFRNSLSAVSRAHDDLRPVR